MSPAPGAGAGRRLTHLDEQGRARMVDVTGKAVTARRAVARCVVRAAAGAVATLAPAGAVPPGGTAGDAMVDVLAAARLAGAQAAKRTSDLVPLCHPMPLDGVEVTAVAGTDRVDVSAVTTVHHRTGVEMEALTACAFTGLSVLAALLPLDPGAHLDELTLWHKSGGRSGTWEKA